MSPYLLASSLTPADVGRRVVVRWALPDGQGTDVLGELESWTAEFLSVRRRDGSVQEVPLAAVLAGKVVEARWPADVAVGELERVASDGWRAVERLALGSWELRAAGGFTRRANSVLPIGSPGMPLDQALTEIQAWYDARSVPVCFQVPMPLGAGVDRALADRGWEAIQPTQVLVADAAALPAAAHPSVELSTVPTDAWIAAQTVRSDNDHALSVLTTGTVTLASVVDDGRIVATGRGSVTRGWLAINKIDVLESHRRRGIATQLIETIAAWGVGIGAKHAFLQVMESNTGARALYERFGFQFHHGYHYREMPPTGDRVGP